MVKMAIVGDECADAMLNTISELFKMADVSVFSYKTTKYGTFKQLASDAADIFIAPVSFYLLERAKLSIDILVFTRQSSLPDNGSLNLINENAIIIIEADDADIYKYLMGTRANLLTYGFNSKASITASSVEDNMERKFIQLCIQRSFKTINDVTVDAQEIPITFTPSKSSNILNEIAAITAALAYGINIRTISLAY